MIIFRGLCLNRPFIVYQLLLTWFHIFLTAILEWVLLFPLINENSSDFVFSSSAWG